MPDFDIDFCQDRRDEVIDYVRREYGADRVAQIITFGKLQAKAAVRDVGRVLGMPYGQVDRIASLIPFNPAKPVTLAQAIEGEPQLQEMRDDDEQVRRLLEIALQLEGLYRNASTHAAGVVIGRKPLIEIVPLYRDPRSDMLITQYSMKYVEQAGAGEVRLPRPEDADGARAARWRCCRAQGIAVDLATAAAGRREDLRDAARGRRGRGVPVRRPGHARLPAADARRPLRGPDRRRRAVPAGPDGEHPRLLPAQARRAVGAAAPARWPRSWTRPTASWSTRNR